MGLAVVDLEGFSRCWLLLVDLGDALLENSSIVFLDPGVRTVFSSVFCEEVTIVEFMDKVLGRLMHVFELLLTIFVFVLVDLSTTWLIDLGGALAHRNLDVFLQAGVLNVIRAHDKLHQVSERLFCVLQDIFEADDVDRDLGFEPVFCEFDPALHVIF